MQQIYCQKVNIPMFAKNYKITETLRPFRFVKHLWYILPMIPYLYHRLSHIV